MFGPNTFDNGNGWPKTSTTNATDLFHYMHQGIGTDADPHSLRFRFSGIRKPRSYSHNNISKQNQWLLPDADTVGAGLNNWNYTIDSFQQWYTAGNEHFVQDGIDFWWNDEGETQWYTYYYWNLAQRKEIDSVIDTNQRMFTLNRAFTSGMQTFPAVTWTGDMQDCSHAKALLFAEWGQPWFTCDLTSPTATVLLRQYQGAVWWPIMRVHGMHGVPRFPWYWGGEDYQNAFREALNTRYAILPYLYSLSHLQYQAPYPTMIHPASWSFPLEPYLNQTYMIGDSVIAADISTSHSSSDPNENSSTVILPMDTIWYIFNSSSTVVGTGTPMVRNNDLKLNEFPVYVKLGSLLPIHPWDRLVQHSQSQKGLLEMQVYSGKDATFSLREDDGISNDYVSGNVRVTSFIWKEESQMLEWNVDGGEKMYANGNDYTEIRVALYEKGKEVVRSKVVKIGASGQIVM